MLRRSVTGLCRPLHDLIALKKNPSMSPASVHEYFLPFLERSHRTRFSDFCEKEAEMIPVAELMVQHYVSTHQYEYLKQLFHVLIRDVEQLPQHLVDECLLSLSLTDICSPIEVDGFSEIVDGQSTLALLSLLDMKMRCGLGVEQEILLLSQVDPAKLNNQEIQKLNDCSKAAFGTNQVSSFRSCLNGLLAWHEKIPRHWIQSGVCSVQLPSVALAKWISEAADDVQDQKLVLRSLTAALKYQDLVVVDAAVYYLERKHLDFLVDNVKIAKCFISGGPLTDVLENMLCMMGCWKDDSILTTEGAVIVSNITVFPTNPLFEAQQFCIEQEAFWDAAFSLIEKLGSENKLSKNALDFLMSCCAKVGDEEKAFEVLELFAKNSIEPSSSSLKFLANAVNMEGMRKKIGKLQKMLGKDTAILGLLERRCRSVGELRIATQLIDQLD